MNIFRDNIISGDNLKKFISARKETPRMFTSPLLELVSKVHWFTPHLLYAPLTIYLLAQAVSELALYALLGYFCGGLLIWTLTEYIFHRIIFHYEFKSKIGQKFHWIAHGVHHDFPNDPKRLVLPPVLSIPLSISAYHLYTSLFGYPVGYALMAGFMVGYMSYEFIHYAVHHFPVKKGLLGSLRAWHMRHHFQDPDAGFGVSSPLWDFIFKTPHKGGQ